MMGHTNRSAMKDAFARMIAKLEAEPGWDAVSCGVGLVGWLKSSGMGPYVGWQNGLVSPEQMAGGRFLEIPGLGRPGAFTTWRFP